MLAADLPGEVLSLVATHIQSPRDLLECMKVCKKWYRLGSTQYYKRKIILRNNHKKFLERCMMTHIDGKRMGDFLEELIFESSKDTPEDQVLTQDQFGLLISSLPRLQVLRFDYEEDKETIIDYMVYFNSIAKDTSVEEFSISELTEDEFDYEFQDDDENNKLIRHWHYTINRALCAKITKFSLYNLDIPSFKGDILLRDLADFKSLKRFVLRIASLSGGYSGETDLHVSKVLNVCPNLDSLELDSPFPWSDGINYSIIYNNLTSLTLRIPDLSQDNIRFLVRHVPNLKKLHMTFIEMCLGELHSSLDSHTLDLLVKYLKRVDDLGMIGSSKPTTSLSFWSLLRDLYDTGSRCDMTITFLPAPLSTNYDQEIHLNPCKNSTTVSYKWVIQEQIEPGWVQYIDFVDITQLQIQLTGNVHPSGIFSTDIINPTLLKHQPDATFISDTHVIYLSPSLDSTPSGCKEPIIRHVFFTDLQPSHNELLKTISTCYPLIDAITIGNWMYPRGFDDYNQYHIDLRSFTNLESLAISFGQVYPTNKMLDELSDVYVQVTDDDMRIDNYYYYKHGQRYITHISNLPEDVTSGDKIVASISCANTLCLLFNRMSRPLEMVEEN